MAKVSRRARGPRMQLRDDEVLVISHLLGELDGLLGGGEAVAQAAVDDGGEAAGDAAVIAGLSWSSDPVTAPSDPALRRLLPDAYPDDAEATEEFRRYTDATLRDGMYIDLVAVRQSLVVIGENGQASLDDELAQSWLRVLNRVRLVLAVRLGIEKASDQDDLALIEADDPRTGPFLLYEWIGYLLSDLLNALN
ncbi:MAG TPA: DUF2017 family protein [Acidothermaceae bacterium]